MSRRIVGGVAALVAAVLLLPGCSGGGGGGGGGPAGPAALQITAPATDATVMSEALTIEVESAQLTDYEVLVNGTVVATGTLSSSGRTLIYDVPVTGTSEVLVRSTADGEAFEDARTIDVQGNEEPDLEVAASPLFVESVPADIDLMVSADVGEPIVDVLVDIDGDGTVEGEYAAGSAAKMTLATAGATRPVVTVRTASGLLHTSHPEHTARVRALAATTLDPTLAIAVSGGVDDIEVDPATGRMFVLSTSAGSVRIFDADGNFQQEIPLAGASQPRGIALDEDGNLYVADTGNHRITKLRADFGYQPDPLILPDGSFGEQGSGNGQFSSPQDVATMIAGTELVIVVSDTGNNRLQLFNRAGVFQAVLDGTMNGAPAFAAPQGLAVAGMCDVVVADSGNSAVRVLSADGETLSTLAMAGASFSPHQVSVASDGCVLVTNGPNRLPHLFSPSGELMRTFAALANQADVAVLRGRPSGAELLVGRAGGAGIGVAPIEVDVASETPLAVAQQFVNVLATDDVEATVELTNGEARIGVEDALADASARAALVARAATLHSLTLRVQRPSVAIVEALMSGSTAEVTIVLSRDEETDLWTVVQI